MSRRLVLPQPPKEYSQEYERIRNREIEITVNEKIDAYDLSVYSGTPFSSVKGSNANWTIPQGSTPVVIPFDVMVKDTDPDVVFDPVAHTMTNPFPMDCVFFINLRHAAAPGGSYDFTIQGYNAGVPMGVPYTLTVNNNATQDIRIARFVVDLPINCVVDLRAFHNRNGPVSFNLQISQWDLMRVSPQPKFLQP